MAQEDIFLGAAANDRTGDYLRFAGLKINRMTREIYASIAALQAAGSGGAGGAATPLSNAFPAALAAQPAVGTSGAAARGDHAHARPSPAEIGAALALHTHPPAEVQGLADLLFGKSDKGHTHPRSEVAGLDAALLGKADLGADGKVLAAQLPASSGSGTVPANVVTTDYLTPVDAFAAPFTAAQGDANRIKKCTAAGMTQVTLPVLAVGTTVRFVQWTAAGRIAFVAGTSATVRSPGNLFATNGTNESVVATVIEAGTWLLSGATA